MKILRRTCLVIVLIPVIALLVPLLLMVAGGLIYGIVEALAYAGPPLAVCLAVIAVQSGLEMLLASPLIRLDSARRRRAWCEGVLIGLGAGAGR